MTAAQVPEPVVIEGDGIIGPNGAWYPEAQVRAAVQRITNLCAWFETLPPELQSFVRWETEL